tara:strand:+ start:5929 stop:7551 length:1623 start_codon:yes stop_codon:yes gene_type:complete
MLAKYQGGKILLESNFSEKDKIKSAGAYWDKNNKVWYFPFATYSVCKKLKKIGAEFDLYLLKKENELALLEDESNKVKVAYYDDLPKSNTSLYAHQNKTLLFGKARGSYADLSDCGTGKTISTLAVINEYLKNDKDFKTIVLAPKSIILSGWVEDCEKAFPDIKIQPVIGSSIKKLEAFQQDANIYVTNYETMHKDWGLEKSGLNMIVCDEAVRLKNPNSKWTKAITELALKVDHKIIISGLITPNNLQEVYAPFNIIEPGIFGKSFYQFRHNYFTPNPFSYMNKDWVPKKDTYSRLTKEMERLIIRHNKNECLDLPDKTHTIREIPMSSEQKKHYNRMAKEFITEVEGESVQAVSAGVKLQKLSQITSGFLYTEKEDGVDFTEFQSAKKKELVNILEGELIDEQVIVFCTYKSEISIFRELYPEASFITGGQSSHSQREEINKFKDGTSKYLFANIKAAKYGLTFTNCSNIIYYSLSYSLDDLYQSQERIHRIGQTKTCSYIYLLAQNTVDKQVYNAVLKKQSLNDMIYTMIEEIKCQK